MVKRVIINADDFGLCRGVNRAVEKAHCDPVTGQVSLMDMMYTTCPIYTSLFELTNLTENPSPSTAG
jgi:hypothetical protein